MSNPRERPQQALLRRPPRHSGRYSTVPPKTKPPQLVQTSRGLDPYLTLKSTNLSSSTQMKRRMTIPLRLSNIPSPPSVLFLLVRPPVQILGHFSNSSIAGSVRLPPLASLNLPSPVSTPNSPRFSNEGEAAGVPNSARHTDSISEDHSRETSTAQIDGRLHGSTRYHWPFLMLCVAARSSTCEERQISDSTCNTETCRTAEEREHAPERSVTHRTPAAPPPRTPATARPIPVPASISAPIPSLPPSPSPAPCDPPAAEHVNWYRAPLARQGAHRNLASMNRYQGMTVEQQRIVDGLPPQEAGLFRAGVQAQYRQTLEPVPFERVGAAQRAAIPLRDEREHTTIAAHQSANPSSSNTVPRTSGQGSHIVSGMSITPDITHSVLISVDDYK